MHPANLDFFFVFVVDEILSLLILSDRRIESWVKRTNLSEFVTHAPAKRLRQSFCHVGICALDKFQDFLVDSGVNVRIVKLGPGTNVSNLVPGVISLMPSSRAADMIL